MCFGAALSVVCLYFVLSTPQSSHKEFLRVDDKINSKHLFMSFAYKEITYTSPPPEPTLEVLHNSLHPTEPQ